MAMRIGIGLGVIPTAARPTVTTAPVNVEAPTISGILTQGQTGTADPGGWSGLPGPNFTYQWKRNGAAISGATGPTRGFNSADVAAGADAITVEVTATNDIGSTPATSAPVTIAAPLQISGDPLGVTVGVPYSHAFEVTGGHGPYEGVLTGTLQAGLGFDEEEIEISGTALSSGVAEDLSVTVTDADGLTATYGPFDLPATAEQLSLVLAASRVYGPGWGGASLSDGVNTVQNARTQHYNETGQALERVRLLYANWYANISSEADNANPITVRAAIEYPVGVYTPLYDIDGTSRDTYIAPGGLNELEAAIDIPAGAQFWVRTRVTVNAGEKWPASYVQDGPLGVQAEQAVGSTDKTTSGTISGSTVGYGPAAILGFAPGGSPKVRMAVMGDSIPTAAGDIGNDGHGNYGYYGKALTNRAPGLAVSVGGTTAQANAGAGVLARRLRLMRDAGVTHVLVTWGTNDFNGGRTFAQIQADLQAVHAAITAAGLTPAQATITPRSSSTDSWATLGNQTVQFASVRVALNDWIRTLPNYVELADAVEDSRNGGKWSVVGGANSGDGIHPNTAGHTKMRTALAAWIDAKIAATAVAPAPYANLAPNIINVADYTVTEGETLALTLMADKSAIFSKSGGADAGDFALSGRALTFEAPAYDGGGDNVYEVNLVATDRTGATDTLNLAAEVEEIVPLEAETAAYIARMATPPDATLTNDINNLILALKTGALSGVNLLANRLDVLQLYGLDDAADGLLDVKNYVNCTLVGSPAFTANKGRTSASGVGMNTGFNPAVAHADVAKNFNHDDGFFAFWIGTELGTSGSDVLVDDGSSGAYRLSCRYTNDFHQGAFAHDTLSTYGSVTTSVGLWVHERGRGSADNTYTYRNNTQIGTNSTFGARVDPNIPLGLGGQFNGTAISNHTGRRYAMFAAGRRMQDANERADFYNAIQAFATARGW